MKRLSSVFIVSVLLIGTGWNTYHLALKQSNPSKEAVIGSVPDTVQVWFNQNVRMESSSLRITRSGGDSVALTIASTQDPKSFIGIRSDTLDFPTGNYTLDWGTAGNDEHVVEGSVPFTVSR